MKSPLNDPPVNSVPSSLGLFLMNSLNKGAPPTDTMPHTNNNWITAAEEDKDDDNDDEEDIFPWEADADETTVPSKGGSVAPLLTATHPTKLSAVKAIPPKEKPKSVVSVTASAPQLAFPSVVQPIAPSQHERLENTVTFLENKEISRNDFHEILYSIEKLQEKISKDSVLGKKFNARLQSVAKKLVASIQMQHNDFLLSDGTEACCSLEELIQQAKDLISDESFSYLKEQLAANVDSWVDHNTVDAEISKHVNCLSQFALDELKKLINESKNSFAKIRVQLAHIERIDSENHSLYSHIDNLLTSLSFLVEPENIKDFRRLTKDLARASYNCVMEVIPCLDLNSLNCLKNRCITPEKIKFWTSEDLKAFKALEAFDALNKKIDLYLYRDLDSDSGSDSDSDLASASMLHQRGSAIFTAGARPQDSIPTPKVTIGFSPNPVKPEHILMP